MKSFLLIILQGLVLLSCHAPRKVEQKVSIAPKDSAEMETTSSDIFSEKFKQGIDFIASGNEPFWSLEIDFSKSMHFKALNGFEITTPIPEGVKAMDSNVTRYSAKTEQGVLTVQVAKQECINDMSGKKLDYSVTVDVKNNIDRDYTTYKGCGGKIISDEDKHDCIDSLGTVWSVIKNNCVDLSATATRLNPIEMKDKDKTPAFVIFSDNQSQVELYLPQNNHSVILERRGKEGNQYWEYQDLKLIQWKGYVLKKGNLAIYGGI
ncbi:MAG: hypothetical protein H0W62_14365 [Chitinophagales bacterium]|nr:hypothetical protein [Chitinophagales bacterium]